VATKVVAVVDDKSPAAKKKRKTHDWEAVKESYVEGFALPSRPGEIEDRQWLTLKEIADRFGIEPGLVRKKSADQRWPEQRAAYQARVEHARRQRRILSLSKEAIEFDGKAFNSAKVGITLVNARLAEMARDVALQQKRRADAEADLAAGRVVDPADFDSVIDARELVTLSSAAQGFTLLARMALGEDVKRVEHTGADGGSIEIDLDADAAVKTIRGELERDDPKRMVDILDGLQRAGLLEEDIEDAVLVDDDEDEDPED
jgi:hypothetical protein